MLEITNTQTCTHTRNTEGAFFAGYKFRQFRDFESNSREKKLRNLAFRKIRGVDSELVWTLNGATEVFHKVSVLPNPDGPLSDHVPSAAIASASKEVGDFVVRERNVPDTTGSPKKRGQNLSYTDKEKAGIAKRAAEYSYHVYYLCSCALHTGIKLPNRFAKINFTKCVATKFVVAKKERPMVRLSIK